MLVNGKLDWMPAVLTVTKCITIHKVIQALSFVRSANPENKNHFQV
jgi:hypothetical protein